MDSQRLQEQNSGLFRNQATPYVITIVHWNKLNKNFHDTCIWEKKTIMFSLIPLDSKDKTK